ncbi:hypothetical protein ACY2DA_01430 [Staphylococcus simulans]
MYHSNSPFKIKCQTGVSGGIVKNEPFYYDTMLGSDRTYYYLNDDYDSTGSIANFKIIKLDKLDTDSKFNALNPVEQYEIAKIAVTNPDNYQKGIMTIMFCDILLTILTREFAYKYNVVISLRDTSSTLNEEKDVNVYRSVLPGYLGKFEHCEDPRIETFSDSPDVLYLFSLETRKQDIAYYKELRTEKIRQFMK